MPTEFGISLHCIKPLSFLEFRTFNFKGQAHLLVMGRLSYSCVFTSKKSAPHPVFCDVCKRFGDVHCITPIQTEHLKCGMTHWDLEVGGGVITALWMHFT